MGIVTLKDLSENKIPNSTADIITSIFAPGSCVDSLSLAHNTGIEAMRRLAQAQLSPIKTVSCA